MTPARDQRGDGPRREPGDPEGVRGEPYVVGSGHRQDGAGECRGASQSGSWVPAPQSCRLEARPAAVLRRRSDRSAAFVAASRSNRGPANQWWRKASTSPETRPGRTRACRRRVVGVPGRPRPRCRPWRRRAPPGSRERGPAQHVQGDSSSQRVGEEVARFVAHRRPHRLRHEGSGIRKVRAHGVGPGVAREVDRHQRVRFSQVLAEPAEQPAGLGEAVQHDQGRTRTADLDMEWHAG